MEITVKLFATLGRYLPPGAVRNVVKMEIDAHTSVTELIQQLKLPEELTHLVLVDGSYIPPEQRASTRLNPGNEFAVFPPIAGG